MALRLLRGAAGAARSSVLCSSLRSTSSNTGGRPEPAKQALKKPKLPVGRFDEPEESSIEREPLEKQLGIAGPSGGPLLQPPARTGPPAGLQRGRHHEFPDGINPTTKERGGPKGPEPTRFGDWERKGRCIDF